MIKSSESSVSAVELVISESPLMLLGNGSFSSRAKSCSLCCSAFIGLVSTRSDDMIKHVFTQNAVITVGARSFK